MLSLLGVDLGLRCGLALFGEDGRLRWQRSQNFGSTTRLRRAIPAILQSIPDLAQIVAEGSGDLAEIWRKEAERRTIPFQLISAELWRREFLYEREQRTGVQAKANAEELAYRLIRWSGATIPHSIRHDAAEATLVGCWGVIHAGWLRALPEEIRK